MKVHSTWELFKAYNDNKDEISKYADLDSMKLEFYDEKERFLGLTPAAFITLLLIHLILNVWVLTALFKFGSVLPSWSIVIALLFLMTGFPLGSLIVIYLSKK
jgi:hypothetical protein